MLLLEAADGDRVESLVSDNVASNFVILERENRSASLESSDGVADISVLYCRLEERGESIISVRIGLENSFVGFSALVLSLLAERVVFVFAGGDAENGDGGA